MDYKYYNRNPNGYRVPDCVTRAISTAMDIPYYDVMTLLKANAIIYDCEELCVCCYEKILDNDFYLPHYYGNGRTVREIIDDFPDNTLILRMDGHLSCAVSSTLLDIFDCSEEIVTDFWIVK